MGRYDEVGKLRDSAALAACAGKRVKQVEGVHVGSERVTVQFEDGTRLELAHEQDCCESVELNDVEDSDAAHYAGALVLAFEETTGSTNETQPDVRWDESWTWTFYRLRTSQGTLVLRWLGVSNGYYSESVHATLYPAATA